MKGQILQSLSGYYDVRTIDGTEYRTRARGNFRAKKIKPIVGDWVEFKADTVNEGYLLKIDERRNSLVRPPVANIDAAIIVTACVEPDFSSNLLDRQLAMLEQKGIEPLLYFSKADLMSDNQRKKLQAIFDYYAKYYPLALSTDNDYKDKLLGHLKQKLLIVMGQTGAGKSTFLNKMLPELNLETGSISQALNRGKHTTRKVTLFDVGNNLVADTPGFSSFELLDITKEKLPLLYPDFNQYSGSCKYRGCLHIKEPQCAVKQAVKDKEILSSRYDNYLQLQEIIANQKPIYR